MVNFGSGDRVATVSASHFDAKRASSKKLINALFLLKAFGRSDKSVELALSLSKGPSILQ